MNKNCLNTFPTMETQRLILREINHTDVIDLFDILSDPDVAQYEYFYPIQQIEQASEFITRFNSEFTKGQEVTWGIVLKESGELIGFCNIGDFHERASRAEIGYVIAQSHWNKGYATEAVQAMVDFGMTKLGLNRIEATITPGNHSSVRVLQKINFVQEGIVRERDFIKGRLEDGIIMAILRRDYVAAKSSA